MQYFLFVFRQCHTPTSTRYFVGTCQVTLFIYHTQVPDNICQGLEVCLILICLEMVVGEREKPPPSLYNVKVLILLLLVQSVCLNIKLVGRTNRSDCQTLTVQCKLEEYMTLFLKLSSLVYQFLKCVGQQYSKVNLILYRLGWKK